MKRFRRISILLIAVMVTMTGFGDAFAGLLTPQQLVRYNRLGGRETDYRITTKEYSAYRKLYQNKLTNPEGYNLPQEEINLMSEVEKKFYTLSPKELTVYKKLSENKCLNILLVRPGAVVYNGEYWAPEAVQAFLEERSRGKPKDIASDGENVLLVEYNKEGEATQLKYNGKSIRNLNGSTWHNLTLKDGHRAYCAGPGPGDNYHHVYYDGKDLGFGTSYPVVEKNHLGYNKWPKNPKAHKDAFPRFVYDGKEYGPITTGPASLAGDRFAYLQLIFPKKPVPASDPYPGDWLAKVNIDGKLYPGLFPGISSDSYVEITEKSACKTR